MKFVRDRKVIARVGAWSVGLLALLCSFGSKPPEPGVYFEVRALRSSQGHLRCGLFADEENWLSEHPHEAAVATIRDGKATCVFRDIEPGTYALTALHDEDDDGQMTKSLIGLPEEGYAASGGAAREGVGRPDWDDAKFRYRGGIIRKRARILYR